MKVLCFHPSLAPYRVDFFNLLAKCVDLKVVLMERNLQTQTLNQTELLTQAQFRCSYLTRGFNIRGRQIRFGLKKKIVEVSPDVVIGYEASPAMIALCVMRKLGLLGGVRLWTSMDDSPGQVRSRSGLRRVMRDWVLRNCDGCIVPSEAAVEAYRQLLVDSCQSLVVSGGTNDKQLMTDNYQLTTKQLTTKFAIIPIIHDTAAMRKNAERVVSLGRKWRREVLEDSRLVAGANKILLFVGRFAPVKNLHWLIGQFAETRQSKALGKTVLVLVGDGAEEQSLRSEVNKMGTQDRVIFAGRKEGEELYAAMSAADALVLCSHAETYGAVVAEAMQWGTPCMVRDTCGAKVLVNDANGCVFQVEDAEGFCIALEKTLFLKRGTESILPVDLKDSVNNLVGALDENA